MGSGLVSVLANLQPSAFHLKSTDLRERQSEREREKQKEGKRVCVCERERYGDSARGRERERERERVRESKRERARGFDQSAASPASTCPHGAYRGISLPRKRTPLGPYRRPMPRSYGSPRGVIVFLWAKYPCTHTCMVASTHINIHVHIYVRILVSISIYI